MPRTAVVALSRPGSALARRLADSLGSDAVLYVDRRFAEPSDDKPDADVCFFDLPLRPVLARVWNEHDAVVLFLPVGAAVRLVAPLLGDKRSDPALVCVDDAGQFAVSVVSGHLGGADALAREVAELLGAEAVITSGSHATGTIAVDLLGREFGWKIEASSVTITRASAAVVNREPVGVYQDAGESPWEETETPRPGNITDYGSLEELCRSECAAAIVISDEMDPFCSLPEEHRATLLGRQVVLFRPRSLIAGMGCRRGVPAEELEQLLVDTFRSNNLSLDSLREIATATLKQDEPGLLSLARKYGVPLSCYGPDELNSVFSDCSSTVGPAAMPAASSDSPGLSNTAPAGQPTPSANARRLAGVWGVSEPAALLASGAQSLLVTKQTAARATLAVARREFPPAVAGVTP